MKVIDVIFALVCGRVVAWIAVDFLKGFQIDAGIYRWLLYFLLPAAALFCLWIADIIGKKFLFVYQAAKFILVGSFATVIDIKVYQLLAWSASLMLLAYPLLFKAVSFLVATFVKYWGNKHWAFEKHEKENMKKEALQFFAVTLAGTLIDVVVFYYFSRVADPQFSVPAKVWTDICIILAALFAALWNFLGYKFIVFKK